MKPRRSMLFIPGANAAMLSTSFVYGADAVMFDLEDAVSLREKDTARLLVYQALQHPLYQDIETVVRWNVFCELAYRPRRCARRNRPNYNGASYETTSQYVVHPWRQCRHVKHVIRLRR